MNQNARTARLGVNAVERIVVRNLLWIFREQPIEDYGIDAHIEICEDGVPSGKLLAAQIKAGESWFQRTTSEGFVFVGSARHLRYWAMHSLPVVLILYNPATDTAWWVPVDCDRISRHGDTWSITVPFESQLEVNAAPELKALALPDYRKRKGLSEAIRAAFPERLTAVAQNGLGDLLTALQAANTSVDVVSPNIDTAFFWAIKTLSHRVPVRLVITHFTTSYVAPELRHVAEESPNFKVRIYPPAGSYVPLHAKYALLDKLVAIYGSANLTAYSWRERREMVLAADDVAVVRQLQGEFERVWAVSLVTGNLPMVNDPHT